MVTVDEQHALKLANAQGDERVWSSLRDLHEGAAADHQRLIATAEAAVASGRNAAQQADANANAAKERIARLQRGEDVPGGLAPPPDLERILRDSGMCSSDIAHAQVIAALPAAAIESIVRVAVQANERASRRYARTLLKKQVGNAHTD
jgi:hypothetical protein